MSELAQFLYKVQPTRSSMLAEGPTPDESAIIGKHFAYLQCLAKEGVVLLAGRTLNTDESSFGIVIFLAESEDVARSIMDNDPAVKEGVMKAEFFPYRIAIAGDNISA